LHIKWLTLFDSQVITVTSPLPQTRLNIALPSTIPALPNIFSKTFPQ